MNNATLLNTIYVNFEARAVFDGSIQGFTKALNKISPELSLSDLEDDVMYGEEMMCDDELGEYLESVGAYWGEYMAQDEMGVYITLPEIETVSAQPCPGWSDWLLEHGLNFEAITEESRAESKAWRASITSYVGNPRYAGMNVE